MLLWGGTTYIYYFRSFHDAKPVPPVTQNPGDATDGPRHVSRCASTRRNVKKRQTDVFNTSTVHLT